MSRSKQTPISPATGPSALLPLGAALFGFAVSAAQADTTLSTVVVSEHQEAATSQYQGQKTRVGKIAQQPRDVPQALTIVTEKLIEDRSNDTLKEALDSVAGLTFNAGEGGRIGDNMNLRGFYSFGDLYLDGIRDVAQYNREVFNLEQVDVLRGSGSMLFGRGQAGGVINQVSKQAQLDRKNEISASVGTNDHARVTADLNHALAEHSAVRLNAMKTEEDSTRDYVSSRRDGFAPTLRIGIDQADEFSLSHYYLNTHNTPDYGVPFFDQKPLDVPTDRFYGTREDYEHNMTRMSTGSYTHRFSEDTEFKTVLRAARYDRDLWATQPQLRREGCAGGLVTSVSDANCINRSIKARGGEENTYTSQSDFSTKFDTAGLQHELLTGMEYLIEDASRWSYSTAGLSIPTTTVGDDSASAPGLDQRFGHQRRSNINNYQGNSTGLYLQDSIEFQPGWKLLVGTRHDSLKADYDSPTVPNATTRINRHLDFSEWSYRSGLMFQPDDVSAYYLAWNDSFNPTADLYQLDNGAGFKPERSTTTELGAKWELFEGDLSLRTALYRAEKDWERNTDVESSGGLLSRKRRTDGLEIEAAGRITENWEVFAGWALMDAHIITPGYSVNATTGVITPHNPDLEGMRPRNAPAYTYTLWSTYALGGGWRVGAGLDGKGDRLAYGIRPDDTPIKPNIAPAYNRLDAMVAYEAKTWSARLNVLNVLDTDYYESVYDNGGHAVPGTQRAFQLTTTLKF